MVICNKHKTCKMPKRDSFGCGGARPHDQCSECGNCPYDPSSKCEEIKDNTNESNS